MLNRLIVYFRDEENDVKPVDINILANAQKVL